MKILHHFLGAEHQPISPGIFREYDIRGIVGETLHAEDAYRIARAFASLVSGDEPFICVSRDGRMSSPGLSEAVCQGIIDSGVNVVDIGIGPTPMLYFAAHAMNAAAAIMVTGSHNPPNHNGMKFMLGKKSFYGEDIKGLRVRIEQGAFQSGKGRISNADVSADYVKCLLAAYNGKNPVNAVWDAGNGAAGNIMTELCKQLDGRHIALNAVIDGRFPAHHPDPSVAENLYELVDEVKKHRFDVGIAFDGDGDRIGVIDDEGFIIWPDQIMSLYAEDVLERCPGATIIADVKSSASLFESIRKHGGVPLMWKTGHSHIKSKLAETGAKLAGEMSGHIFFADRYYGYDDALYAAVRLLGILSRRGIKLSDWRKSLPVLISTPEIRFPCDDDRKFTIISEVAARLKKAGADFSDIDGVRVNTNDGWWLLRASNTQPMLVARCESKNQQGLNQLTDALQKQLTASNVSLPS